MSTLVRFRLSTFNFRLSTCIFQLASFNLPLTHALKAINFCPHLCVSFLSTLAMEAEDANLLLMMSAAYFVIKKARKKKLRRKKRSVWMIDYLQNRDYKILKEVDANDFLFKNFTRMSKEKCACKLGMAN